MNDVSHMTAIAELQLVNAQLTEENAKLNAQHAEHTAWRAGILQELALLQHKYGTPVPVGNTVG